MWNIREIFRFAATGSCAPGLALPAVTPCHGNLSLGSIIATCLWDTVSSPHLDSGLSVQGETSGDPHMWCACGTLGGASSPTCRSMGCREQQGRMKSGSTHISLQRAEQVGEPKILGKKKGDCNPQGPWEGTVCVCSGGNLCTYVCVIRTPWA